MLKTENEYLEVDAEMLWDRGNGELLVLVRSGSEAELETIKAWQSLDTETKDR
jgi:hypothetical protein